MAAGRSLPVLERLLRHRFPEIAAALFGVGWFLWAGGWRAAPPTALDWLGGGDWSQHFLGWLFFRNSRWSFPLGRIDGFVWPVGTTVGFTDSNPLLAIPSKVLSPLLPVDFQYIGPWLLVCFALQGWFGARLAAAGSPSPAYRAAGGALVALAPPLLARVRHDTLCAQFTLIALVALHLAPVTDREGTRRALLRAVVLTLVAAAVHPYLACMALALSIALTVRAALSGGLSGQGAAAWTVGLLAVTLVLLAALGYLTEAPSHGAGFGLYASDLLAFVNPLGASSLLPESFAFPMAWEGNAYLGAGGLLLCSTALALGLTCRRGLPRTAVPLAIASLLLGVFALSSVVRAAGRDVLDLRGPYRPLLSVVGPFRSSGRFIWPLYYAVLGGALAILPRLVRRPGTAAALLWGALALQLVDLAPHARGAEFQERAWRPVDPRWRLARGAYDHLALVPAQVLGGGILCAGKAWGETQPWASLGYEAYVLGLTINSGYVARGANGQFEPTCRELAADVAAGRLDRRTIYVLHASQLGLVAAHSEAACSRLDGFDVCVPADNRDAFREALYP
jgi:hypothetical protein